MSLLVKIAHDYICPWCWIGFQQVEEFSTMGDVAFDWVGHELFPDGLEWIASGPVPVEPPANKPPTPTRLELAYAAAGMEPPTSTRPQKMRSHNALEASEYAKSIGVGNEFIARMYRAYWEEGREINDVEVIAELAVGLIPDISDLRSALAEKRFDGKIVKFDDESYSQGVYNVPTFFIGDERLAEQPTSAVRKALSAALKSPVLPTSGR